MTENDQNAGKQTTASPGHVSYGSPVADAIAAIVGPIAGDLGLEIYDLEFSGGVLRVEIDTPHGQPAGVSLDSIALITRLLGRELDHSDPVPGRYTLEVSSPGLERNLRRHAHYSREIGKTIAIRLHSAIDGQRRFQGVLVNATDDTVTVHVVGEGKKAVSRDIEIPLGAIERAKTVFVWDKAPKPGSPEARKNAEIEAVLSDDELSDDELSDYDDDSEDTPHSTTEATAS